MKPSVPDVVRRREEINARLEEYVDVWNSSRYEPTLHGLSQEMLSGVAWLSENGIDLQRPRALMVLRRHEDADRLLEQLESDLSLSLIDVLLLRGQNWFLAKKYDRSLVHYHRCIEEEPRTPTCYILAARSHTEAKSGSIAAHYKKAISLLRYAEKVIDEDRDMWEGEEPDIWGIVQWNLASALTVYRLNSTENSRPFAEDAVQAYEKALGYYRRDSFPQQWATIRIDMTESLVEQSDSLNDSLLNEVIRGLDEALEEVDPSERPSLWGRAQLNKGACYFLLQESWLRPNTRRAIRCYRLALRTLDMDSDSYEWAMTQSNLARALAFLPEFSFDIGRSEAIKAMENSLGATDRLEQPIAWAERKISLGAYHFNRRWGNWSRQYAIAYGFYSEALEVFSKSVGAENWVICHYNSALILEDYPAGGYDSKSERLAQAVWHCEQALSVTEDGYNKERYKKLIKLHKRITKRQS